MIKNNIKGSSETIRQLSDSKFVSWLAGVIDGDGNFDIRDGYKLKAIRIKLLNRDIRILTRILNKLKYGRIRQDKHKKYSVYIVSTKKDMKDLCEKINGQIRLKYTGFEKSCKYLGIDLIQPNYKLNRMDPYLAGLVDTDGSIVFNYSSNRIECNIELKLNEYSDKLDLNEVIWGTKPYIIERTHSNKSRGKIYYSKAFKYQNEMILIYDYFMKNRLYSDLKFYRISLIPKFIEIRDFKKYSKDSPEKKIYNNFILKMMQYKNPKWGKLTYIKELR